MNDGEEGSGAGPSHVRVILPIFVADDLKEGAPDLLVMGFGIRCDFVRRERSQKMVRSRDCAVEQQKPSSLKIRGARDAVQEALLVVQALLQDALDKFGAADGRPEDDESIMRGVEIAFPQWRRRPRLTAQEGIDAGRLGPSLARPERKLPSFGLTPAHFSISFATWSVMAAARSRLAIV